MGSEMCIRDRPNLVLAGVVKDLYDIEISFAQWLSIGLPISVILLGIAWVYLTKIAFPLHMKNFPGGVKEINRLRDALGSISTNEVRVSIVFGLMALLLITRQWLQHFIPQLDDTIIAMGAGILLCLLPASVPKQTLLTWEDAVKMPWGVLILFGGGMALAKGFTSSGLAIWIGSQAVLLKGFPIFALVLILILCVNFLTEILSLIHI